MDYAILTLGGIALFLFSYYNYNKTLRVIICLLFKLSIINAEINNVSLIEVYTKITPVDDQGPLPQ